MTPHERNLTSTRGHPGRRWATAAWRALATLGLAGAMQLGAQAQKLDRPPPLPRPTDFVEIAAGASHTCARRFNGQTYCWGQNDRSQVGVDYRELCNGIKCVPRPRQVISATAIRTGEWHSCALDSAGVVRCWGENNYRQSGQAEYDHVSLPTVVAGGRSFADISAGVYTTCGTSSSGIHCWGRLDWMSRSTSATPVQITSYGGYRNPTVGQYHACAVALISDTSREVDCWGLNRFGEIGVPLQAPPGQGPNFPIVMSSMPVLASRVAANTSYTCSDQTNGLVYCFGDNGWGALGNGNYGSTWQAQLVGGGMQLSGTVTGRNHACALDPQGRAWCWGNGNNGELGHGAFGVTNWPIAVAGGRTYRALAAGAFHTCAIGTDNVIYCWGDNQRGQLGLGVPSVPGGATAMWAPTPTATPE